MRSIIRNSMISIFLCLFGLLMISGCQKSSKFTLEEETKTIAEKLGIPYSESLVDSVSHLHDRGFGCLKKIEKIEEKDGWIYFTVIDDIGNKYYADTNKKGYFGTVLSQNGYDNMLLLSQKLGLERNRNLLYSAEYLEIAGCSKIKSIYNISKNAAYEFKCKDDKKAVYTVNMSLNGKIGNLQKDKKELFAKPE